MTKKEQVEALAQEHERVDVLFNCAGYFFIHFHFQSILFKEVDKQQNTMKSKNEHNG